MGGGKRDLCKVIFYNVIEIFSGTTYPIVNTYFIKVCEVKIALMGWLKSLNDLIRNMVASC